MLATTVNHQEAIVARVEVKLCVGCVLRMLSYANESWLGLVKVRI